MDKVDWFFLGFISGVVSFILIIIVIAVFGDDHVKGFDETGYFIKYNGVVYELKKPTAKASEGPQPAPNK